MTTKASPLSVIKINMLLSFFNSFMALYSSLLMFAGLLWAFFNALFTSTLNSSDSPWFSLVQACSTAVMHSPTGICLGLITNFGPWDSSLSWSLVKGVLERFWPISFCLLLHCLTHRLYYFWTSLFEQPLVLCCCNTSNLAFCLSKTLWCLHSMTLLVKLWHSLMVCWSRTPSNWWKYVSLLYMYISIMLLIDLMHSFSKCFSALLIISETLIVCVLVFSLILTGNDLLFQAFNQESSVIPVIGHLLFNFFP